MDNEIIYVCDSVNNKNIRRGELAILEKHEDGLYFEFGENQMNVKKRFYNDLKTLNKDFEELLKIKNREKAHELVEKAKEKNLITPYEEFIKTDLAEETALTDEEVKEITEIHIEEPIKEDKKENKKMYKKYKKDLF